jgi:hypothetical protein
VFQRVPAQTALSGSLTLRCLAVTILLSSAITHSRQDVVVHDKSIAVIEACHGVKVS